MRMLIDTCWASVREPYIHSTLRKAEQELNEGKFIDGVSRLNKLQQDFQTPFVRLRAGDILAPHCSSRIRLITTMIAEKKYPEAIRLADEYLSVIPHQTEVTDLRQDANALLSKMSESCSFAPRL